MSWVEKNRKINNREVGGGVNREQFISFSVKNFCATVTKKFLLKCLRFPEIEIQFTDDKKIIYQSRKLLLFDKGSMQMKKGGDLFDVAMGSHGGAEVYKLVGTFFLEKISEIYKIT